MFCLFFFSNSSGTHYYYYYYYYHHRHHRHRLFQDIGAAVRDTAGWRAWRLCGWAESRSRRDLQRDKHHNNTTQLTNQPTVWSSWSTQMLVTPTYGVISIRVQLDCFQQVLQDFLRCPWHDCVPEQERKTKETDQFWIKGNPLCCSVCVHSASLFVFFSKINVIIAPVIRLIDQQQFS